MNINRHVVGGSAMHRPKKASCRPKTWAEKKRDAQIRAINFIGKARIEASTKNAQPTIMPMFKKVSK